ncbi:MAG: hypothetical protein WCT19_01025 [Candidatus Paceibacterota bacterium]
MNNNTAKSYLKSEKWQYALDTLTICLGTLVFLLFITSGNSIVNFVSNFGTIAKTPIKEEKMAVPFPNVSLEAKSAYVYDAKTGKEIFELNGEAQLPLASLTKIMTAVTALSILPDYAVVNIDKNFLKDGKDAELYANESWKFKDLLSLTLVESSNAGAGAIAAVAGAFDTGDQNYDSGLQNFIDKMNEKAKEIGLNQTYYTNGTGLDTNAEISGAYGSAKDMAKLMSYAVQKYPDIFEATKKDGLKVDSLNNIKHDAKNTNLFVDKIPMLLGSKTGLTDLAGGNLAVVFDAGFDHPVGVVVLGSSEKGRFEDVEKLVWSTIEYLNQNN